MSDKICGFNKAWAGMCENTKLEENGNCSKHQWKCSCGKLAVRECDETHMLVCGRPLCENCQCRCWIRERK